MVLYINLKLIQDSKSVTIPMVLVTLGSVSALFGLTYKEYPLLLTEEVA